MLSNHTELIHITDREKGFLIHWACWMEVSKRTYNLLELLLGEADTFDRGNAFLQSWVHSSHNYISHTIRSIKCQGNCHSFDFSIQVKHTSKLNNSVWGEGIMKFWYQMRDWTNWALQSPYFLTPVVEII